MINNTKDILIIASILAILACAMIGILSFLKMEPKAVLQEDPSLMLWVIGMLAMATVTILVMLKAGETKTTTRKSTKRK